MKPSARYSVYSVALFCATLTAALQQQQTIVKSSTSSTVERDGDDHHDHRLLPLERQKKSVEHDLDLIMPSRSVFRERQRQLDRERYSHDANDASGGVDQPPTKIRPPQSIIGDPKSIFSERRRHHNLVKSDSGNRRLRVTKKRMFPMKRKKKEDCDDERPQSKRRMLTPDKWDPRFPAFDLPDRQRRRTDANIDWLENDIDIDEGDDDDDEQRSHPDAESVDALLRRLAWARADKRLMLIDDGKSGFYVDRGERKRRSRRRVLKKASRRSTAVGEDELDDIMADEKTINDSGRSHDSNNVKKRKFNPAMMSSTVRSKSPSMIDSGRSVSSKRVKWDDYFGVDKRSVPPPVRMDEPEVAASKAGLKDFLIKWYSAKMLSSNEQHDEDDDDEDAKKKREHADEDQDDEEDPLKSVDERLRRIEDVVLLKATNLLEGESAQMNGDDDEDYVLEHLKAAFSLEKMRSDLSEFEKSLMKLKAFDEGDVDEDDDDDDDDDDRKKRAMRKKSPDNDQAASASSPPPPPAEVDARENGAADDDDDDECPVWMEAIAYCDDLGQALGDVGPALTRSCVEHMICHSCEAATETSQCDRLYLSRVTDVCGDDFRCQAMAGAMRSVFLSEHDHFRRRNHAVCARDECLAKIVRSSARRVRNVRKK